MAISMEINLPHPLLGQVLLHDLEATDRLGEQLVQHLPVGSVVALCGTLGAGKTRLVQAMTRIIAPTLSATSPTFTLMHRYNGSISLNHLDAYRIRDFDELLELGIEEICDDSSAITLIEWADRFPEAIPVDGLWIVIELAQDVRIVKFFGDERVWKKRLVFI